MIDQQSNNLVAFRVDASLEIGTGHIFRCLTLARGLAAAGWECHFLLRELPGNLIAKVKAQGFKVHAMKATTTAPSAVIEGPPHAAWLGVGQDIDARETREILEKLRPAWLVVDHYSLDKDWERSVCPSGLRLFVIDDLADRPHIADVLLDQNCGRKERDYEGLLPSDCKRLIGPDFALLRPEFAALRLESLKRRQKMELRKVLVAMGGVDQQNVTLAVLQSLELSDLRNLRVAVVLGESAPWLDKVRACAGQMRITTEVMSDVRDMALLMSNSDVAVGGAGTTSWERCCLGLPTIIVTLAANQVAAARAIEAAGAGLNLGEFGHCDLAVRIPEALRQLSDPELLAKMSQNAAALVEGLGTSRCIEHFSK